MVEKAAEVESRGHQETLGVDSGQGYRIMWPSVTGSLACSPKWTDVLGAETEYRLLNNLFFYSRLCSQHLPRFYWGRTREQSALLPFSTHTLTLSRTAMEQSLYVKAATSSTSQLQPTVLSVPSWCMKKHWLVCVSLLHKYLLFISEDWL